MQASARRLGTRVRNWPPWLIVALGLGYEIPLCAADRALPGELSLTLFYLLGPVFAAWAGGARPGLALAGLTALLAFTADLAHLGNDPELRSVLIWNGLTRLILFCAAVWSVARAAQFTRTLGKLVDAGTAELKREVERHKLTWERISIREAYLRALFDRAPVLLISTNPSGVVAVEEGSGFRALGVQPGQNLERRLDDAYHAYPELLANLKRALAGEEFTAITSIGSLAFDCAFTAPRSPAGTPNGCVAVGTNITERRRLEREIVEISDREQARIGQDLHDGLCQRLVSLAFDASTLRENLRQRGALDPRRLANIEVNLDAAITEARQLSRGLFPIRLEFEGLAPALDDLARNTRTRFGIECDFDCSHPPTIKNAAIATHLYRIAQEAVTNAIKHARPTQITIELAATAGALCLRIGDNGCGATPDPDGRESGLGLHIMKYRANAIGASLAVERGAENGTVVACVLPLSS